MCDFRIQKRSHWSKQGAKNLCEVICKITVAVAVANISVHLTEKKSHFLHCFCSVEFLNTVKSLLLWFLSDFMWHSNSCMGWWHYRCRPPETHLRSGLYEGMCHSQMKRTGWFAHSPAVWLNAVDSHHPQLDDPQVSCCRYWMWRWTRSSGHQRGRLWIGGM